jgi:hypothetical protein
VWLFQKIFKTHRCGALASLGINEEEFDNRSRCSSSQLGRISELDLVAIGKNELSIWNDSVYNEYGG